jgi:hypothetical protein
MPNFDPNNLFEIEEEEVIDVLPSENEEEENGDAAENDVNKEEDTSNSTGMMMAPSTVNINGVNVSLAPEQEVIDGAAWYDQIDQRQDQINNIKENPVYTNDGNVDTVATEQEIKNIPPNQGLTLKPEPEQVIEETIDYDTPLVLPISLTGGGGNPKDPYKGERQAVEAVSILQERYSDLNFEIESISQNNQRKVKITAPNGKKLTVDPLATHEGEIRNFFKENAVEITTREDIDNCQEAIKKFYAGELDAVDVVDCVDVKPEIRDAVLNNLMPKDTDGNNLFKSLDDYFLTLPLDNSETKEIDESIDPNTGNSYLDDAISKAINASFFQDSEVQQIYNDTGPEVFASPEFAIVNNELQNLYLSLPDVQSTIDDLVKGMTEIESKWEIGEDGKIIGLADKKAQEEWDKTTKERQEMCQTAGIFCEDYWYKAPTYELVNQYNKKYKDLQNIIDNRNAEITKMNALLEGKEGEYSEDLQYRVEQYQNGITDWVNKEYSKRLVNNKTLTTKYKEYGIVANKMIPDILKDHARVHNPELRNIDIRSAKWNQEQEMTIIETAKQIGSNIKNNWKELMFTPFRGIRGIPEVIDDVMGGVPQYEKGKLNIEENAIQLDASTRKFWNEWQISIRAPRLQARTKVVEDLKQQILGGPFIEGGASLDLNMKVGDARYLDKNGRLNRYLVAFRGTRDDDLTVGEFLEQRESELEQTQEANMIDYEQMVEAYADLAVLNKLEVNKDFLSIEGFMQHLGMATNQATHMVPSMLGSFLFAGGTVAQAAPHPFAKGIGTGAKLFGGALMAFGASIQGAMTYSSVYMEGVRRQMQQDPKYAGREITPQEFFEALKDPKYGDQLSAIAAGTTVMGSEFFSDLIFSKVGGMGGKWIFANPTVNTMMKNGFAKYLSNAVVGLGTYKLGQVKEWGTEGFQDWLEQGFSNRAAGQNNPFAMSNIDWDQVAESAEGGWVLGRLFGASTAGGALLGQSAISDIMIGSYDSRAKAIVSKLRLDPGSKTATTVEKMIQNLKNDINNDNALNKRQKANQILSLSNIRSAALSISPEFRTQTKSRLIDLIIEQKALEKNIKRVNNKEASILEIERKNEVDTEIQEIILAEHQYQKALEGPTQAMGMFNIGAAEDLNSLAKKYKEDPGNANIESLLNQYQKIALKALGFDTQKGTIKREDAVSFVDKEFGKILDSWDPAQGSLSNWITSNISPKKSDFYGKEQQLDKKGKETSLSDERAQELQADETQETQGKEFEKRKYPTDIAAIEKQTADVRPEILTNIKNSVKQFIASSVGKVKEIGGKGKKIITKLSPAALAKELKAQNTATRAAVVAAIGKGKQYKDFVTKVINDGYIETIPIAAMKKRFKTVKGFNIEKIGRETLGAGTGIYKLSGLNKQALIDFYTKDQSGRRSFIDLLAKGLTIEQFQEVKIDPEFMNDLAFKLKEANSELTAEEFMNEVERIYDGRTKEFASLDKTESLKDKKPVKEITKSKVKKITIQKEGELTKKEKDEVIAKEKRVRDLDEIVPGTKETFGEARDRVVNEFLDEYPQWRSVLRSATTHGIDRALFQTAEVFDRAIAKAKRIVKQITLGSKQIISGKKLNLKGLENIETKKFKDQQLKGIDDLIDLYKDFATFLQKNPKSAWVMGEIIADSADSPRSIFRTSASYGFYAIDKNGNRNTTEEGVAEHTKPNMAQQRPLTSAMMEGPAAVEALRPRVKATYMQGFFLKTDDNLVNINNKSTMPEVFYTDVLPAVERGNLDYLIKKYPGIVSWIRPAVAGVNPNFYKSTYNGKTIAEIFGVQVEKKYRNDPNVITAQNAAIIRILKGESKNKVLRDFKTWGKEIGIMQDSAALNTQKEAHTILEKKCSSPCRVPRTSQQVKKTLENSLDTQVNAQKVNKKRKGISVFDMDDTLAKTKEKVIVNMPYYAPGSMTEATMELTPAEFAERAVELEEMGASFDFSQFEDVKGAEKGPLADLALRRQDKFGSGDIYVLTARPQTSAQGIKTFLDGIGLNIPIENITGLQDGSPQAKADWVLQKTKEGYNDFYFADDSKMNVDAVKQILDQVDVKSKVQQAIVDKETNLDTEFNEMLEESQGMKSQAEYSKTRAQLEGKKKDKGFFKWLGKQLTITPSAEDFMGLMYDLMGSGKQGNRHAQWISDNLIKPYNKAEQQILSAKVAIANDFAALKKAFPSLRSTIKGNPLMDLIGVGPYTKSQAMRVYMWAKQGMEIPGLSKRDQNALVKAVENDMELMSFADNVMLINKSEQYPAPGKNWVAGTIDSDIMGSIDKDFRRKVMTEFDENAKIIFSDKNMNKLEAIYGKKWVDALKDSLRRMKSGSNRPVYQGGGARIVNEMLDWLNGSVGAVMFLNVKSGLLQLISNVNFINWGDNNMYQAAKAFASKEYWPTVLKLMNSDYLVNRRDGLKINVNEAELANAAKDGGMKGAIAYLLDKGFVITRIMDSLAIATGGATFYINRRNALLNRINPETGKTYTQAEAEAKAFDDFYAISEESQQSSNPSKISQQQASLAGRVLLAFQNVTMQYNRMTKKSIRDLYNRRKNPGMTQRESDLSNLSKIVYYTTVQNVIFNALQQALFVLLFDDESDEEEKDRAADIAHGMVDSLLFGLGFGGAAISTVKNVTRVIMQESDKKSPDYEEAVWEVFNVSPVLDSKIRKLRTTAKTFSWNMEEIKKRGWSLDNPTYLAVSQLISAATNIPIDRLMRKMMNMRQAMDEETKTWQRVALILGWTGWSVGLPYWGLQSTIKQEEKAIEKAKVDYKNDIRKLKAQGYKKVMYRNLKDFNSDDIVELQSPAGTVVYYVKTKKKK